MHKVLPIILLFTIIILLFPSSVFAESKVRINEIYPSPLDKPDVEFAEIYIEDLENLPLQLTLCDDRWEVLTTDYSTCKQFEITKDDLNEHLSILELGRSFLNNPGDALYLVNTTDPANPLILDSIFYGDAVPPQEYSDSLVYEKPDKGQSISYISEAEEYKLTAPTKGQENWLVNLDFEILDSVNNIVDSVQKGELIYFDNHSKVYDISEDNYEFHYLLNGDEITNLEIDTKTLELGTNTLTLEFVSADPKIEDSISKELTILENFDGLIISEVFPNPKGEDEAGANEWVEIFNSTNRTIQLHGLQLVRIGNSSNDTYSFGKEYLIGPEEYYLLYPTKFALTNSDNILQLQDTNNTIIDELGYSTTIKEETSVISFENEIKITTTPTPASENIYTPTLEDLLEQNANKNFNDLKINTVLPNPEGSDEAGETEWIEVCNSSTKDIDLFSLVLIQETSKVSDFTITDNVEIKAGECLKVYVDFSINNTAATLILQNLSEKTFDTVSYDAKIKEDQVLVRKDNELVPQEESDADILGAATEEIIQTTIQDAKSKPEDTLVKVKGVVTAEPDIISSDAYYIQDETGGVQISNKSSPDLKVGDEVQVTGSLSSYHAEIRITDETEDKIGNTDPPTAKDVKIEEFTQDSVGSLITINGTVTKTSGNTIHINDGTGEIKVYIKDSTGIERPPCRKGYYAKITGILSVWDTNDEGEPNYRLLPRYQEDVWISETLAGTGSNIIVEFLCGLIFLSISSYAIWKEKSHDKSIGENT